MGFLRNDCRDAVISIHENKSDSHFCRNHSGIFRRGFLNVPINHTKQLISFNNTFCFSLKHAIRREAAHRIQTEHHVNCSNLVQTFSFV